MGLSILTLLIVVGYHFHLISYLNLQCVLSSQIDITNNRTKKLLRFFLFENSLVQIPPRGIFELYQLFNVFCYDSMISQDSKPCITYLTTSGCATC